MKKLSYLFLFLSTRSFTSCQDSEVAEIESNALDQKAPTEGYAEGE
ncbi:MAG: hypothetical protein ABJG41_02710 [Cyclobacteriaceae bacterium]